MRNKMDQGLKSENNESGGLTLSLDINSSLENASKISGTVTGLDGTTLLQSITATAYRWSGSSWHDIQSGDTDANGNYTIRGLCAGTYRVMFHDWQNGDYITEVYNNAPDLDSGTDIIVPAETTVTGIDTSLMTVSKVSGTVTGPNGTTPLQGIQATAYRWSGSGWDWMNSGYTDANGEYTIGGLSAGTYRVQFEDWQNGDYFTEVYDNALDLDSGKDIIVPAETTVSGINASLASLAPPRIVALRQVGGNDWEILYIGTVGRDYILQEAPSLTTNSWDDVGTSFVCRSDTNTILRQSSTPVIFWRIRNFP